MGQMLQGVCRQSTTASEAVVTTTALARALPLDPTRRMPSFWTSCCRGFSPSETLTRDAALWTLEAA